MDCTLVEIRESRSQLFWYRASCGASGTGHSTETAAKADFAVHQGLHDETHTFTVMTDGYSARRVRIALARVTAIDYTEEVS